MKKIEAIIKPFKLDDVREALADRPGLVLADIQLADGSSGIDAVQDILAIAPVPAIFITAATSICFPIVEIDGQSIGNGHPGAMAERIRTSFFDVAEKTVI